MTPARGQKSGGPQSGPLCSVFGAPEKGHYAARCAPFRWQRVRGATVNNCIQSWGPSGESGREERKSGGWGEGEWRVGGGGSGGTKSFAAVTSQSILQLNGVDDACVGRGNVGAGGGRAV